MARFCMTSCVTLYHYDYFEADSIDEARKMRDNVTWEWDMHLDDVFIGRTVDESDMNNCDNLDLCGVDWEYDGPVMGKQEFCKKYTSLC